MFNKLLQLQIAPNPVEILSWMTEHGVDKTLNSYGYEIDEVFKIASLAQYQFQNGLQS